MRLAENLIELSNSVIALEPGENYSDFGVKRLRSHGLGDYVDSINAHEPLERGQADTLLSLSLPLLLKLGELHRMYSQHLYSAQPLRPVFFFNSDPIDLSDNFSEAAQFLVEQIASFQSRHPEISDVWVAFTTMRFDDEFIHCVSRLRLRLPKNVHLVGPTSGEIKSIPWIKSNDGATLLRKLFVSLLDVGFTSLDGGTDLNILSTACDVGLKVTAVQLLRTGLEDYLDDLFAVRSALCSSAHFAIWTPSFRSILDDLEPVASSPLAAEILRALIIARLVLPPHVCVQAPVSLLRPKFAHLALNFGVSDLGYVSAIGSNENDLLSYNSVREVLTEE